MNPSKPLFTLILRILQYTSLFTPTESSGRTGTTPLPRIGIAKDGIVINVKDRLPRIGIKSIAKGTSIVTNEFARIIAGGKAIGIACVKGFRIAVVTNVRVGIMNVENAGLCGLWFVSLYGIWSVSFVPRESTIGREIGASSS